MTPLPVEVSMRRFFRFSIRDLLWLTFVAAVGLASGLSSYRCGREAGRIEVMATFDDGQVTKWTGAELLVFENGQWRPARSDGITVELP
jgi:hypothetical protein